MRRRELIERLGLDPKSSEEQVMHALFEQAESPEEKAEAAEALRRLKTIRMDDSLDIVVRKFPLAYILQNLIRRYGRKEVEETLADLVG